MTTTRRDIRRETTRRAIVAAAWEHSERVGIAGISLRELAADVGMRAPSLYTYFPSKDAIYDAMFAEGYQALDAFMDDFMADRPDESPAELLTNALDSFVQFCQASPARYQIMFTRSIPGWQPSQEAYDVSVASYAKSTNVLAELGLVGDDARDVYVAVAAGLAAQQMANDPQGDRWRGLATDVAAMLLDRFGSGKDKS